jgi:dTDP-4-amino-4,6-dideoxygalactose transaminase
MTQQAHLKTVEKPISFIDLQTQQQHIRKRIDAALSRVLDHGGYIMGPEVYELEKKLAEFCCAKHVISCSNGTDALALVLRAKGIGPGDAVLVPSFTFAATAEVVCWLGATPVFVDVLADTFNMDPLSLENAISSATAAGLTPRAVIPVDLFGQLADYHAIEKICQTHGLWILSDAAQSFGGTYHGRKAGTIGLATTTSFFPAKPLGCYGDGGAIFTDDDELVAILHSLRVHGQGEDKYQNIRVGMNGRLDTLQAAILKEKLAIFPDEIIARQSVADRYNEGLKDVVKTPFVLEGLQSVWAQYTLILKDDERSALATALKADGIPTAIYYPKPLHQQIAYQQYPVASSGLKVSEDIAMRVLSLPMHAYLAKETQDYIIQAVRNFYQK